MSTDCQNKDRNAGKCTCTYAGCPRHAVCCDCLHYHLAKQQLPACCFPADVEKTFDRSFKRFIQAWG